MTNAETGFFRPVPLADDRPDRVPLHRRRASSRARSTRSRSRTSSAITFLGEQLAEKHPVVQRLERRLARRRAVRLDAGATGRYRLAGRSAARVALSRRAGLQGHSRPSACASNFSDPLQLNRASVSTAVLLADADLARGRAPPPAGASYQRYDWTLGARRGTAPTSTISSARRRRAARATRSAWATSSTLVYDEPRRLDLDARRQPLRQPRPPARVPERPGRTSTSAARAARDARLPATSGTRSATSTTRRAAVVGRRRDRRRRRHDRVPDALRQRSTSASALPTGALVALAAQRRRGSRRRPRRPVRQLLLRRLRQQLRRPPRGEALPRVRTLSRARRAQRDRRPQLRASGMLEWNLPPLRFRARRHARLLPDLDAAGALRRRPRHESRRAGRASDRDNVGGQLDFRFSGTSRRST